jgi:hypothetical protein
MKTNLLKNNTVPEDEAEEWLHLTPAQRLSETTKLWQVYLSLGGRLDPEPDPQSPFNIQEP